MLRDHFHPPLKGRRHWEAFHSDWACNLAADLNSHLPEGFVAEPSVQFGIEVDVSAWKESRELVAAGVGSDDWVPAEPSFKLKIPRTTDIVQVDVFEISGGPVLVGAIELVSPANKDRPTHREAFVSKCEALLVDGIGLLVVDIVTERHANLHLELLQKFGELAAIGQQAPLYAAAYRPAGVSEDPELEIWHEGLTLNDPLPVMPLFLKNGPCLRIDLQSTYQSSCERLRLP